MAKPSFLEQFKTARRVAVPLISVVTSDQSATMQTIQKLYEKYDPPIITWNIIEGLVPLNNKGKAVLKKALGDKDPAMMNNPAEALAVAGKFPGTDKDKNTGEPLGNGTVFFFQNAHRFLEQPTINGASVSQAIANLRDLYKKDERTFVMLSPGITLPLELRNDVVILDEPLPNSEELAEIANRIYESAGLDAPPEGIVKKAVEATRGLSSFATEQVMAMALTREGFDLDILWERKRQMVEQTPGLKIYRGEETYKDLRGIPVIKNFLRKIFKGKFAPSVIVFVDEIEKMFAGVVGDLSGTSQEQLGEFLRWMQDFKVLGSMLVGHPGCSKSFLAKCTGNEFECPTVELNMSALKGSLVGETGLLTRTALKTISAMGSPLVLATSNSLGILPPELRRRFQLGTFFFDLPTREERMAVWELYIKKLNLFEGGNFDDVKSLIPGDEGWTPAEIETCCDISYRLECTLKEAAEFVVPVMKSSPEKIKRLRTEANGRFLSASSSGTYKYDGEKYVEDQVEKARSIRFEGVGSA